MWSCMRRKRMWIIILALVSDPILLLREGREGREEVLMCDGDSSGDVVGC
jgi:hypothetical protein